MWPPHATHPSLRGDLSDCAGDALTAAAAGHYITICATIRCARLAKRLKPIRHKELATAESVGPLRGSGDGGQQATQEHGSPHI